MSMEMSLEGREHVITALMGVLGAEELNVRCWAAPCPVCHDFDPTENTLIGWETPSKQIVLFCYRCGSSHNEIVKLIPWYSWLANHTRRAAAIRKIAANHREDANREADNTSMCPCDSDPVQ